MNAALAVEWGIRGAFPAVIVSVMLVLLRVHVTVVLAVGSERFRDAVPGRNHGPRGWTSAEHDREP